MAATPHPRRQLADWMERPGNWELKAMLAAEIPEHPLSHEEVGEAMLYFSHNAEEKSHHLSKRDETDPYRQLDEKGIDRKIRPLAHGGDFAEESYARELAKDSDTPYDERQLKRTGVSSTDYVGRTLVDGTTSQKDILWREQLLDTVVRGAEEVQWARDAINMVDVQTTKGDHPVRGDDEFADKVAQGASIPFDELDWSQQSWDTEKRGRGAFITEELVEDALVDVIEENLRHIGRSVENGFNRIVTNEIIDNPGNDNSVGSSATDGIQNANMSYLFEAIRLVTSSNFPNPDSMVMHPKFEAGFSVSDHDNLNYANRAGSDAYVRTGALPDTGAISSGNMYVVPGSVYNGSNTYDWSGTTDDIGAVVYSRDFMYGYMYRDLETKDFDDPIRDLEGANVRAQYDASLAQTNSAAQITST